MEGPFAAQRVFLAARGGQQGIVAQLLVVVEVFVAEGFGVNPLREHLFQEVLDKDGVPSIVKATGQLAGQTQGAIDLAQEQHAAVAGEGAAGKIGHDFSGAEVLKEQRLVFTVCRRRSGGWQFHLVQ
jgi:hypothetical protein